MSDATPKKEKKDKKRKSEAAEIAPVPPAPESASAEAVLMDVDGEKALKKAKKDKKDKKEKRKSLGGDADDDEKKFEFHVPLDAISVIASPLAQRKLSKKLFRTVKRSSKLRQLKRGVKEVVKALRKGDQGLLLLASNITPVDVVSHIPLLAEEAPGVEYCWVLSKEELGAASGTKRATSVVLISSVRSKAVKKTPNGPAPPSDADVSEWKEGLEECMAEVKKLETTIKL